MNALLRLSAFVVALSAAIAGCNSRVVGGGGSGGGTACPAPTPGMCSPTGCIGGFQRTGEASCQGGAWVCVEQACQSGCNGSLIQVCVNGQVTSSCCPAGAPCVDSPYCDLGGGACLEGGCQDFDAGPSCASSVYAAKYDQSCAGDADCVGVFSGALCGDCFCPNSAINTSGLSAYKSDYASGSPGVNVCNCANVPPAICSGGVCVQP